ncbi:hypothetical protein [Paraburkholderia sediminicola]|uniref:hypothetical protein n=1 Tax=Paraburkholderia TaxID=1822464 RepID=UPI0038BA08DC
MEGKYDAPARCALQVPAGQTGHACVVPARGGSVPGVMTAAVPLDWQLTSIVAAGLVLWIAKRGGRALLVRVGK